MRGTVKADESIVRAAHPEHGAVCVVKRNWHETRRRALWVRALRSSRLG